MAAARSAIAVNPRNASGAAMTWTTADATNNNTVPNWQPGMALFYRNLDGAATHPFTIIQNNCPVCGIETDRTVTAAISEPGAEVANLRSDLFVQADGGLYINPTSTQLRFAALLP